MAGNSGVYQQSLQRVKHLRLILLEFFNTVTCYR